MNGEERRRTGIVALLGALAGAAATAVAILGGWSSPTLLALAALIAVGIMVKVPVPFGGSVPLAFALVMALAVLLPPADYGVVAVVGSAAGILLISTRSTLGTTVSEGIRTALASALAVLVAETIDSMVWASDTGTLGRVFIVGTVVLVADAIAIRQLTWGRDRLHYLPATPVYLTMLCGGALLAVAADRPGGTWMAAVALFPLLIARFAFQRYTEAHQTFGQTVQALGIVPELAGLAPIGHSERSAVYAEHLGRTLGIVNRDLDRVVLAARLHHLGAVSFDASEATAEPTHPATPDDMAAQGATILREAGFPGDVADLLETARAGTLDGEATSLDAAVIRVATAFDELVGDDAEQTDRALSVIVGHPRDRHSRRAAAGLMALIAAQPELVDQAIEAGARFTEAASGLDLDALVTAGATGELLPFARRRG